MIEKMPQDARILYTIGLTPRKEVLRRLLAPNHERAKAEQAAQKATSSAGKPHSRRTNQSGDGVSAGLFSGEENSQAPN